MKKEIQKLLDDHKNLILSEAHKHSSNVPVEAMQIEAFKIAREAAKDYDPQHGTKFSTYLVNSLKKLSRLSTSYGQVIRMPENQQFMLNRINKAESQLQAELGRDPTLEELSDTTQLNLQTITNILQNKKQAVNIANMLETPVFIEGNDDEWLHFVHHDLSVTDKLILEHRTGFGGKKVLSTEELAKKLKVSPSHINSRVKLISDKIAQGIKD